MQNGLKYKITRPEAELSDYVEYFWFLNNEDGDDRATIGLPDGLVDLMLFKSDTEPFQIIQLGGLTEFKHARVKAGSVIFCVSFRLPAVEYIFGETIAEIVNGGRVMPAGFWEFREDDLLDFDRFVEKATRTIKCKLPVATDPRKLQLFELIYSSRGTMKVKELSEKVFWSSRQINRYFNQQFGISLKAYCKILRFRASLEHIAQGKLFPEEPFFDQNHFIKEIKKFSGVVPSALFKNEDDRFILLSTIQRR